MATNAMNLNIPVVGFTPGPTWATLTNADWNLVAAHDHSSGKGVPIGPSGIYINADLSFNNLFSGVAMLSTQYMSQANALASSYLPP